MGQAEVISLDEVRANQQRNQLRQRLHASFDAWLDTLEAHMSPAPMSLSEISDVMWELRQDLMGDLTQTILAHTHEFDTHQDQASCPRCERSLTSRRQDVRVVQTLIGPVELRRPYFYCSACRCGFHPLDSALALAPGCHQFAVQKALAKLTTEMPYETAHQLFGDLTGLSVSAKRMHTLSNPLAEGLTMLDVTPAPEAIREQIRVLHGGKRRRPVMVLAIDGAHVPLR